MQIQCWDGAELRFARAEYKPGHHGLGGLSSRLRWQVVRRRWLKELKEKRYPAGRRRNADRAEAREEFELERVISCCSADHWRRAQLDLGRRKPFDDLHWATTLRTAPKSRCVFSGSNVLFGLRLLGRAEMVKAKR
jgi:hypothetical protein